MSCLAYFWQCHPSQALPTNLHRSPGVQCRNLDPHSFVVYAFLPFFSLCRSEKSKRIDNTCSRNVFAQHWTHVRMCVRGQHGKIAQKMHFKQETCYMVLTAVKGLCVEASHHHVMYSGVGRWGGGLPRTYRSAALSIPEREGHLGWWVMPEGLVPVVFPLFPAFSAPRSWLPGVVAATFELHVVPSKDRDPVVRSRSQGQE